MKMSQGYAENKNIDYIFKYMYIYIHISYLHFSGQDVVDLILIQKIGAPKVHRIENPLSPEKSRPGNSTKFANL